MLQFCSRSKSFSCEFDCKQERGRVRGRKETNDKIERNYKLKTIHCYSSEYSIMCLDIAHHVHYPLIHEAHIDSIELNLLKNCVLFRIVKFIS